ncbi:MAG TPA: hypothetical protein VK149_12410 [Sideroxyarcus sp.]|nr:hypothetical protein [Sideroxyarcus sp.]
MSAGAILLAILFILLLVFLAVAPHELKQIALTGTWVVMLVWVVVSVLRALLR